MLLDLVKIGEKMTESRARMIILEWLAKQIQIRDFYFNEDPPTLRSDLENNRNSNEFSERD